MNTPVVRGNLRLDFGVLTSHSLFEERMLQSRRYTGNDGRQVQSFRQAHLGVFGPLNVLLFLCYACFSRHTHLLGQALCLSFGHQCQNQSGEDRKTLTTDPSPAKTGEGRETKLSPVALWLSVASNEHSIRPRSTFPLRSRAAMRRPSGPIWASPSWLRSQHQSNSTSPKG